MSLICVGRGGWSMAEIELTQNIDGRWSVTLPGLVVTDLTRETAEAFAAAYQRLRPVAAA
jgi:hypothetical protein